MNVRSTRWPFVLCGPGGADDRAIGRRVQRPAASGRMVARRLQAMVAAAGDGRFAHRLRRRHAGRGIRDLPDASVCRTRTPPAARPTGTSSCARAERSVRFLRGIDAGLPQRRPMPRKPSTRKPRPGAVRRRTQYNRDGGCVVHDPISPGGREGRASVRHRTALQRDSIYRFLAPDDHTGDLLGYWATEGRPRPLDRRARLQSRSTRCSARRSTRPMRRSRPASRRR